MFLFFFFLFPKPYLPIARFLFLFFFFLSLGAGAQSYIGKSRTEIYRLAQEDFKDPEISFNSNSDHTYLKIVNDYESLYYYLENDVCVKFVVYKPYSCNCLETDFRAYESKLIAIGELKWTNQDYSRIYEMTLYGRTYSMTITPHPEQSLSSTN